jgi:hypothetical protein
MPTKEPAAEKPETKTIERWCAELGTPDWLFAAARALRQWPIGKEISQADYLAAVEAAGNVKLGG